MTSPLLLIPGASTIPLFTLNMTAYGTMLMATALNNEVKEDMKSIDWNPFNSDAQAAAAANNVSFYNGVFVFKYGSRLDGSGISMIGIGLGRGANASTLMHEYGHHKQQRMLGVGLYVTIVAIPSLISASTSTYVQHNSRWYEQWATDWGNGGLLWW